MRLGINIPNFGPESNASSLLDWARFAEERGFAVAMMSDHVAPTPEVSATYPPPFFDSFTSLAWLAGQTRKVLLGTSVALLAYRHPLLTARVSSTLDQLSGGRFILGVGVGWADSEFAALGVPFAMRGKITSEYLEVITTFWHSDVATFDGSTVAFAEVSSPPGPVNPSGLAIWVGGTSPTGITRAARYAHAWHPNNPDPRWLEETGLPALERAAAGIARDTPALAPRIKLHLSEHDERSDRPLGVGSLAQVLGDLRRLERLGCSYVILDTNPDHPVARDYAREREALAGVIDAFA